MKFVHRYSIKIIRKIIIMCSMQYKYILKNEIVGVEHVGDGIP